MPAPSKPQIKIGALQRLTKEYQLYLDERETLEAKVRALEQATPVDEYDVKRSKQVLDETERVMVKVRESLKAQIHELRGFTGLKPQEQAQAHKALDDAAKYVK